MNSIKVCEYSRSRSFHDDLILQDQASGERSQDHWSSGFFFFFFFFFPSYSLNSLPLLGSINYSRLICALICTMHCKWFLYVEKFKPFSPSFEFKTHQISSMVAVLSKKILKKLINKPMDFTQSCHH